MPVLFTSTSSRPNRATVDSTARARSSALPAFPGTASTRSGETPAVTASDSAAAVTASGLRDVIVTDAPRDSSSSAMPCPMPRLAPVTSATLPVKSEVIPGNVCRWTHTGNSVASTP